MLAKDILKQARYTLSDTDKNRWSDDRLLALLDEGVKNIALTTTLFVETMLMPVVDNVADIDLSDLATKIIRIEYLDEALPLVSYEELDKLGYTGRPWQQKEGERPEFFVYDKQKRGAIRQYPLVRNAYNPYIIYSQTYGITTGITYSDILPIFTDVYGDLGDIPDDALLKIFYIRKHDTIDNVEDELHIDELCKQPLIHYVAGRALRDNQDTQNRVMGGEELNFYTGLINEFSIEKSKNFARTKRATPYRPLG